MTKDDIVVPRPARTSKVISVDPVDETKKAGLTEVTPDSGVEKIYAANVTDVRLQFIQEALENMISELKTMNRHLAAMTDEEFDNVST